MRTISITADSLCLILSLIVIYGTTFEMKHKSRQKTMFNLCVIMTGCAIFFDLMTQIAEGNPALIPLDRVFTFLVFVVPYGIITVFAQYLALLVEEKGIADRRLNRVCFRVIALYSAVATCVTLAACLRGQIFMITADGCFVNGPYHGIYLISAAGDVFLCVIAFVLFYVRRLSFHDAIAMSSYLLFPLAGLIVNIFNPDVSISYPLSSLSCITIYIMLQSEQESKSLETTLRLHQMVRIDELTGLQSRRAYTEEMELLPPDSPVGILFCDINGLKYTNDNMGHEAGDRLLQEMAKILKRLFRETESFRISGDEFVVIAEGMSEIEFYNRCNTLRAALEEYEYPLAAIGLAYGPGGACRMLVEQAEANMRTAKEQFHRKYPRCKRV